MRDLHARMLGVLLAGEGLRGVAELAAAESQAPVAIVLPARGMAAASGDEVPLALLEALVAARLDGDADAEAPVDLELAIEAGDQTIGYAFALPGPKNGLPHVSVDLGEVLRAAALAALTEVAVVDARDEVAADVRGTLLEDVRAGRTGPDDVVRRAARLGADLSRGAIALVAEIRSERPRHAAALITGEYPGAIAEPLPASDDGRDGSGVRVYAVLPARGGDEAPESTQASARTIVERLRAHGPAAYSSFCVAPAELGRAISEAELMLDVISRDERISDQLSDGIGDGVYRLLFRAMASDPDEVRRFFDDTVEPLVTHDREYRTDLLGTLEAYLANDCNMNATARAVYAHRHTVAHRLGRVRELTCLDPALGEDRERLGLGIKAYRIVAPTLPK